MIKLIVSDIDGTLIRFGGILSERTKRAIKSCVEKGIVFVPASGRTLFGAIRPFQDMRLDFPVISANGGRIDKHLYKSLLYEECIPDKLSKQICEILISAGCYMTSYVGTQVYVLPETNGYNSTCFSRSEAAGNNKIDIDEQRRLIRSKGTVRPYKYEAYSDDKALLQSLKQKFISMGLSVSGAFDFNLEIMALGAGKGSMVRFLSGYLNIRKEEIMALGDGSNDITLLEASGLPVAMENASASLKPHAKVIAPRAEEDGAAQIIEEYIL